MFINFKREPESSISKTCESLSLMSLVIADSWFIIIFLTHFVEAIWYSNLLVVNHYLIISFGLLWYFLFLNPVSAKNYIKWKNWFNLGYRFPRRILLLSYISTIMFSSLLFVNSIYPNVFSYPYTNNNFLNVDNNEIKIGALLGLSGISSERGQSQKLALEVAEKEVNENFSKSNTNKKVVLFVEDTERKPDVALAKLKILADKGITIIIGPQTSTELKAVKEYADKNDILLISHSSTAPSLSISDDNIFRFVQNDKNQGYVIAKKMFDDGIRVVIPILRDDIYGNELYQEMRKNFEKLGGNVTNEIKYNPPYGEFAASLHRINFIMWNQDLKSLNIALKIAKQQFPNITNDNIGVYIIAYDEIVPILIQAQSHNELKQVRWYGSDGTAKNDRILKHHDAIEFAKTTKFLNPMSTIEHKNKKFENLKNKTNLILNSYDANAYDALWISSLTENMSKSKNIENIKSTFNKVISSYSGASGNITLDISGDRYGTYDFWSIREKTKNNKEYEWEKIIS
jgi:branched-chain amino acid transport system substrate-binding protein